MIKIIQQHVTTGVFKYFRQVNLCTYVFYHMVSSKQITVDQNVTLKSSSFNGRSVNQLLRRTVS